MYCYRRHCRLLMLLVLAAGTIYGQKVEIYTGYEQENFRWSIAGNSAGAAPNVYSELKWRSVGGAAAAVGLQWEVRKRWRFFASGSRVFTHSGTLTDTDYGLDNRHDVLYNAQFQVRGGYSEAGTAGIGYCVTSGRIELTPFVGYTISKQYFPVTDAGGPFAGLNSSYSAKWMGPLVRVGAGWRPAARWQVVASVEYDQVVYRATADWNLISTFRHPVSFRHHADGYGVTAGLGLRYAAGGHLGLLARAEYFDWETGKGVDELYLATGGSQQTQLNEAVRYGFGARVGADWRF